MKTFKWTVPSLPLTREEKDGNKGNARVIHHPSELTPDDLQFAESWGKIRAGGLAKYLGITALKVLILFLVLYVLANVIQEGVNLTTTTAIFVGSILGLFLKLKSQKLLWDRSEKRFQSIVQAQEASN